MTIAEARTLLGALSDGKTDNEVGCLKEELTGTANVMYDMLMPLLKIDASLVGVEVPGIPASTEEELHRSALDGIRWRAYAHGNPNEEGGE